MAEKAASSIGACCSVWARYFSFSGNVMTRNEFQMDMPERIQVFTKYGTGPFLQGVLLPFRNRFAHIYLEKFAEARQYKIHKDSLSQCISRFSIHQSKIDKLGAHWRQIIMATCVFSSWWPFGASLEPAISGACPVEWIFVFHDFILVQERRKERRNSSASRQYIRSCTGYRAWHQIFVARVWFAQLLLSKWRFLHSQFSWPIRDICL